MVIYEILWGYEFKGIQGCEFDCYANDTHIP